MKKIYILFLVGILYLNAIAQTNQKMGKSPLDELPPYIERVSYFGQRADWSHDGKRILFIEKTFGDVYELELETKIIRPMTHHYFHEGYTRALYLQNGDILLSGARQFNAKDPWPSRDEENAELWVLKKELSSPPVALNEHCSEGPAVSRKRMHIAWTKGNAIYTADITNTDGVPQLTNKKKVLDEVDLPFRCNLETQNFRPPDEKEILFSAYGYMNSEVMGVNIETGKVIDYSVAPNWYDEPEGIFPDGEHILVESDKHVAKGTDYIDIYKLELKDPGSLARDVPGKMERLTFFNEYPGFEATNPVVSDDGRFMAFQYAKQGDPAGMGKGILIFDLVMFEKLKKSSSK